MTESITSSEPIPLTGSHSESVAASFDNVWSHMLEKVDRPDKFIKGVHGVEILSKKDGVTHRKMKIPSGAVIEELITSSAETQKSGQRFGRVVFTRHNDKEISGRVLNDVLESEDGKSCTLTFTFEWAAHCAAAAEKLKPMLTTQALTGVVRQSRDLCEAAAAKQSACSSGSGGASGGSVGESKAAEAKSAEAAKS